MGEFANAIIELSGSDVGKHLSQALQVLSDVEKKAQDLQQVQAQEDFTTLLSTGLSYFEIWSYLSLTAKQLTNTRV